MAKNKKRQHSRTVELKRQAGQERLADEKARSRKRMDPTARALLYSDLVFLSLVSILYANGLMSDFVSGLCTVLGTILILAALWFQFGKKKGQGGPGTGPRL